MYVRVGSQWRKVIGIMARVGTQWRRATGFASAFSAVAPDRVDGYGVTFKPSRVTSSQVPITVTGGVAPFRYSWTFAGGDSRIRADDPTLARTAFSAILYGDTADADFAWTVTDSTGATTSGSIHVSLTHEVQ